MRSCRASGSRARMTARLTGGMLFHISEESDIARFEPRASEYATGLVVWAIDEGRLCNYLVPRDCPRVTYYAGADTTATDVDRFLGSSPAVVAIESGWLERVRSTWLYCYHMPTETFECLDACAGYYVSRVPVIPHASRSFRTQSPSYWGVGSSCELFRISGRCAMLWLHRACSSRSFACGTRRRIAGPSLVGDGQQ